MHSPTVEEMTNERLKRGHTVEQAGRAMGYKRDAAYAIFAGNTKRGYRMCPYRWFYYTQKFNVCTDLGHEKFIEIKDNNGDGVFLCSNETPFLWLFKDQGEPMRVVVLKNGLEQYQHNIQIDI